MRQYLYYDSFFELPKARAATQMTGNPERLK